MHLTSMALMQETKAARFLSWDIADGHAGYKGKDKTTYSDDSMLKWVHACLSAMSAAAAAAPGNSAANPVYYATYKQCQALYKAQKCVLPCGAGGEQLDPQDSTQVTTFSTDQLVQRMADGLLASPF